MRGEGWELLSTNAPVMRLLALCCVLTGALALAACGGSSSSSSQASPSPEASTAEGAALGSPGPAASGSAAEAAPSTAPTRAGPFFSDLTGIYGADKIEQLAQLQVYGPINSYSFDPTKPIMRREFVVWIFNANNAIQDDETKKIHNAAPGGAGYFSDVPPTDRDFSVIQGMQDAGI